MAIEKKVSSGNFGKLLLTETEIKGNKIESD